MSLLVAIDGSSGSGKSTLARALAARLGLPYVNTGLMYRAIAAQALRDGVGVDDAAALERFARALRCRIVAGTPPALEVEGWSDDELMTDEIESVVSAVARHPEVRAALRQAQRTLGAEGGVIEGRDIGSVVFPHAPVKILLVAAPQTRVVRRAHERGNEPDAAQDAVLERDRRDARTTPPVPAPDAVVIDTTDLDELATLRAALAIVTERTGG